MKLFEKIRVGNEFRGANFQNGCYGPHACVPYNSSMLNAELMDVQTLILTVMYLGAGPLKVIRKALPSETGLAPSP